MAEIKGFSDFPHPAYATAVLSPLFEATRRHFLHAISRINRAHCVMLCETGILTVPQAAAIAFALEELDGSIAKEGLGYKTDHEDVFFALEEKLAQRLGYDLAGRLHTGRSRNDMDHTIFRLELMQRLDDLLAKALRLAESLFTKARSETDTIIVAYTHGQPAQPTTFGHYLFAVLETLLNDITRIEAAMEIVDRCPMGSAAITTTGFPVNRQRMAVFLGFNAPTGNSYALIAGIDYLTSTYSAAKLLFVHLGRVIQDLQFWSSFEVAQLHVPDGFVQISSIMPQKRNPVAIEHLRALASTSCGDAETMLSIMHNTPFTDMNDSEGGVQIAGYRVFENGGRAIDLLSDLVSGVSIESENVDRNIQRSCITITELADELVRRQGLSFREAHKIGAAATKGVVAGNETLQEAGYGFVVEAFREMTGQELAMTTEDFKNVVSVEHFIEIRDRPGGPGRTAMKAAAGEYRNFIDTLKARRKEWLTRRSKAACELDAAFSRLLAQHS